MYIRHGEAASNATDNITNIQQMNDLRLLCSEYHPNDVLSMDETALFWKMSPDRTLATKAASGERRVRTELRLLLHVMQLAVEGIKYLY